MRLGSLAEVALLGIAPDFFSLVFSSRPAHVSAQAESTARPNSLLPRSGQADRNHGLEVGLGKAPSHGDNAQAGAADEERNVIGQATRRRSSTTPAHWKGSSSANLLTRLSSATPELLAVAFLASLVTFAGKAAGSRSSQTEPELAAPVPTSLPGLTSNRASDLSPLAVIVLALIAASLAAPTPPARTGRHVRTGSDLKETKPGDPPIKNGTYEDDGTSVVLIGRDWTYKDPLVRKQGHNFADLIYDGKYYRLYLSKDIENALDVRTANIMHVLGVLESVPEARRNHDDSVTIQWGVEQTGSLEDVWVWPETIQKNVTYSFPVPGSIIKSLLTEEKRARVATNGTAWWDVRLPSDLDSKNSEGWEDMRKLLQAFLEVATSPEDARTEGVTNLQGEWYEPPKEASERQRQVGDFYSRFNESRGFLPPLHRRTDSQGVTTWTVGRGWRYDNETVKEGELVVLSDGQAALNFSLGDTMRFVLYLPRVAEKVLKEKGLLTSFLDTLSTAPSGPLQNGSLNSSSEVIYWGERKRQAEYTVKSWFDGHTYYNVTIPAGVEEALRNDSSEGWTWGQMSSFLDRSVLAIAEAFLNLSGSFDSTEAPGTGTPTVSLWTVPPTDTVSTPHSPGLQRR